MQGAIIKSYYAKKMGYDPKDVFVVSIMPCTAKKFEKERPEMEVEGVRDVDAVLTTRELGDLIKRSGIQFARLPDEDFDRDLVGEASGAGVIFGVTGGVMEAALRTVYHTITGMDHDAITFEAVRGFDGIKEASISINGTPINVAVAHGMKNAKVLMDEIRAGKSKYQFIEIMGCPGGCINGGGQPIQPASVRNFVDVKSLRASVLYKSDAAKEVRFSHENSAVKRVYDEFFGEPGSHKAHEVLHTSYVKRGLYNEQ